MDWEFVGKGIAEIGNMVAGSIMEKYQKEQAEKRFLGRFEEMLRMQEPFKIAANNRVIQNMKDNVKMQFQLHTDKAEYDTRHQAQMDSFFNSEDLMKEVQKNMESKDEKDILWAKQWQRTSGKIHGGQELDDGDEAFIESLNSVARANINSRRYAKRERDRTHQLKVRESENRNKMLENQLINYQSLMSRRDELTDVDKFNLAQKIDNMELQIAQAWSTLDAEIDLEKDRGIWSKKTGLVDPIKKEKFLKRYPEFRSRFTELETATTVLKRQKELYKELFGSVGVKVVSPKRKLSETELQAYMTKYNKTREQSLKDWANFKGK